MRSTARFVATVSLASWPCVAALAMPSAQQGAGSAANLTPLGGEKAANAAGTIPAWDGGLTKPPAGYVPGKHYVDPFAADKPLFTITQQNAEQYAGQLSEGHKAMLKTYRSFKMNVYPTRRSASAPQRDLRRHGEERQPREAGRTTATASRAPSAAPPSRCRRRGVEVIWNHMLRYRGETAGRWVIQATPTRGGQYTLVQFDEETQFLYHLPGMTPEALGNRLLFFKQTVIAPARLAGGILLVHETLDQVKKPRDAWLYNPGQRRVRRAPQVAYDNPGTAADNMRTSDQLDMFNGAPDKYDWKLVGKREIYVPYNAYRLQDPKLKYKDIITPLHINPDHCRYELHRVWVVDATLRPGERHIYKRRVFYVDEDSWQILLIDQYDNRDQLWRVSEGHAMNFYNVPAVWTSAETHTDLQAGRYLVMGLFNESRVHDFSLKRTEADFTPDALRRKACGRPRAALAPCGAQIGVRLRVVAGPRCRGLGLAPARWRRPRRPARPRPRPWPPASPRSRCCSTSRTATALVAVGERGHVLVSQDGGAAWTQAEVPTRALLTGVHMHDAKLGWAVGHDEVVLRTQDGGATWERVHHAPERSARCWTSGSPTTGTASPWAPTVSCSSTSDGGDTWEAGRSSAKTTST